MLLFDLKQIQQKLFQEFPNTPNGFLVQHHHQRVLAEQILQRSDLLEDMRVVLFITVPNCLSIAYCVGKEKITIYRTNGAGAAASYIRSTSLTDRHQNTQVLQSDLCTLAVRDFGSCFMLAEMFENLGCRAT